MQGELYAEPAAMLGHCQAGKAMGRMEGKVVALGPACYLKITVELPLLSIKRSKRMRKEKVLDCSYERG